MKETDEFHYCKKCFFFVCRECMDKNQLQFGMKQEELKDTMEEEGEEVEKDEEKE